MLLLLSGITIGLDTTVFSVTEEDGAFVELCASVLSQGDLETNIEVELFTSDDTAEGTLIIL